MNRETILGYGMAIFGMCVLALGLYAFTNLVPIETVPCGPDAPVPPVEDVMPADDEMCGRYHLRKRTDRFFKRVG